MTTKKRVLVIALAAFLMGSLWVVTLRYALQQNDLVHYHANFGLFIEGKQDTFDNFAFYEEIQACSADAAGNPRSRAHMHQPNNHTVHVHDSGVTWGAFFTNIGYGVSDKSLTTTDGVFISWENDKQLHFLLNGQSVSSVANRVIGDKDVLLVSYGTEDATALKAQYSKIPTDAAKVDAGTDPASCGGSEKVTPMIRLKHALNLTN